MSLSVRLYLSEEDLKRLVDILRNVTDAQGRPTATLLAAKLESYLPDSLNPAKKEEPK